MRWESFECLRDTVLQCERIQADNVFVYPSVSFHTSKHPLYTKMADLIGYPIPLLMTNAKPCKTPDHAQRAAS